MFEQLINRIRDMEREHCSRVKRITCNGHDYPLNITLENGYRNSYHHGAGTWANQRRLRKEIRAAFPEVKVIRIYTVSEGREKELSERISV